MTALEYMEKQVQKHRRNYEAEAKRGCPATQMYDILMKIHYYEMAVSVLREQDNRIESDTVKTESCPWCKRGWDWDVIDGDFGQYVRHSMIRYCFRCGRRLEEA